MVENFDEFEHRHSRERENEKEKRERLSRETKPEWAVLKGLVQRFAIDNKEFDGHKFEWSPYATSRPDFLRLNNVAVTFLDDGERNGMPQNCRVRFDRRPLGPREAWLEEDAGVEPVEWSLEPVAHGDGVAWSSPELNETLSSADLAETIAKELSDHHLRYEEANRWPAA